MRKRPWPVLSPQNLAFISQQNTACFFRQFAELKPVIESAKLRKANGVNTILFVDEIHRFNKAQQDAFLPVVEDGTITLIGATTENPSFELNSAVLSRCQVIVLHRLTSTALESLILRRQAFPHNTFLWSPAC